MNETTVTFASFWIHIDNMHTQTETVKCILHTLKSSRTHGLAPPETLCCRNFINDKQNYNTSRKDGFCLLSIITDWKKVLGPKQ